LKRENQISSRFIGDFKEGDTYHHGAVQLTTFRNREYIKKFRDGLLLGSNPGLSQKLGIKDPDNNFKKKKYGIDKTSMISQGYLFNIGFGLSVHDISFNAIANLSYKNLKYGVPAFEGDLVYGRSTVLGKKFLKDSTSNGAVQVKTTLYNQNEGVVLEFAREVLVRAEKGQKYNRYDTTARQPDAIDLSFPDIIPFQYKNIDRSLLGEKGKTFDDLVPSREIEGTFEKNLSLVDFSWLQISTLNDASVHHDPGSGFIGYGGAVKALAEGQISSHIPLAYHIGMNNGSHSAPTYPGDITGLLHSNGSSGEHEKIRSHALVLSKSLIHGRDDAGIITIRLVAEKYITDAGMKALEKSGFGGMDKIFNDGRKRLIKVLDLEIVIALPTENAFI